MEVEITTRKLLEEVLDTLPEERLRQLLDFAQFLSLADEQKAWCQAGQASLAKAYELEEREGAEVNGAPEGNG